MDTFDADEHGPDSDSAHEPFPAHKAARNWRILKIRRFLLTHADKMLLTGVALISLYMLIHLLLFQFGRDQGIYAVVASQMARGGVPYVDAWDFKPPGVFFVYWLAQWLFGPTVHSIRLLEVLAFLSLPVAFALFSRRHLGDWRPGALGGAVAIFAHVQLEFWHTAQPESFGAIAIAWALVCATYEPRPGDSGGTAKTFAAWAAAGALYCSAALLKPPLGGGFLASLAWVLWRQRSLAEGKALRTWLPKPLLAFSVGGALPLLATLGYFQFFDGLRDLYETLFVFTPHYTSLSFDSSKLTEFLFRALTEWVSRYSAYTFIGLTLFLGLPPLHPRESSAAWHVCGVVSFQLIGVALQAKFFAYHYGAALPLAGLLSGWGFWKLWLKARTTVIGMGAVLVLLFLLHDAQTSARPLGSFWTRCENRMTALFDPKRRQAINDRLHSTADVNARSNRLVANWLQQNLPADSCVYIWGFEPVIYFESGLRPCSRFIYNVPQRAEWGESEFRAKLLDDLYRDRPAAIVVAKDDVFNWVTGNRHDSLTELEGFEGLRALLHQQYRLVETFEDLSIYLWTESPALR